MVSAVPITSLTGVLGLRAGKTPDRTAYIFLAEGEEEQGRLTYAALDAQAQAIAAALSRSVRPGERALLLYPPGLDFIAAFFGCLYAGVIAVPAYPPRSPRMMPRLLAILADARPAVTLASAASLRRVRGWLERTPETAALSWLATDELDPAPAGWIPAAPKGDAVAFLQYTSGSTSAPKGVMVTHANLIHNQRVIQEACGHSEESVFVSWLPPYHDLGLIGNLLQATWVGAPCVQMAPVAFLQNPSRWLRAVSRYRGTTSGGPNFAYDLCVRKVPPAEIERLDLSSWRVAFNGAEPVREATLARFAEAFAPAGFQANALYPCYGLAEATLMVSGGRPGAGPAVREIGERRLMGCGRVLLDLEVAIVDPEAGTPRPAGAVGEIWVTGDSVARGYWNRPEETAHTFGAILANGRGPWLRTGDLGALDGGELFVAGRLKDLIILRGQNHYPQDLEATAGKAHPALADGTAAAFAVDLDGEERLVIVHEVERHAGGLDEIAAAVRQAIAEEHEALVYEVVLVPTGGVPRTTSGKVQRRACRDLYLQGELRVLGASRLSPAAADAGPMAESLPGSLDWLRRAFSAAARVDPTQVDPDRPLSASGLDSLAAVELKHAVEEATGVFLSLPDLLEGMTLREIERRVAEGAPVEQTRTDTGEVLGEHPLSWNQRSLWFLHRLAPESPAYNIAGAARLSGANAAVMGRALQALVDRHPMLRATFTDTPDGPVQHVAERAEAAFTVVDATGWSDGEIRNRLHAEAFRPFDLSAGPLLRAALLRRDGEAFLALAVHHIAADFWSMAVLARELGALAAGETPPPPAALYTDFARRQGQLLESSAGERLWEHWRERLAGAPQLELPTDRPRRPVQTLRGGSRGLTPSPERAEGVHRLAATHGCTPFVALLAAWQAVLSRWSGQDDFLVGAPMAGRSARAWGDVVGYFVNLVPLRADLAGDPTVREALARVRSATFDALAHQDFPFALLAERLQPERDPSRPPLVPALLTFEKAPAPELAPLAAFAVAVPDVRLDLGGLSLESLPLDPPAAQLDLSLQAAELPGGLALFLQWDADLFEEATAERMLSHLDRLLAGMAEANRPLLELPLLTAEEGDQILLGWSGAGSGLPAGTGCLHELFEASVERTPGATALIAGDRRWTYDALNRLANRLAHHLRRLGAGPEQRIGVLMGRSGEMVAALLGILKAGAAYVPLDPAYPDDWLSFAAQDAQITFLLTEGRFCGRLAGWCEVDAMGEAVSREPEENLEPLAGSGNLAYVMYTSGSTGRPKGVALEHRAPVERMFWARAAFSAEALAGALASTSICFDLSIFEVFAPLSWGGTVILADNALALPGLPAAREVTLINTVPSAMAELASGELPPGLRTVNLAGEALPLQLVERIYRHAQIEQVLNLYGPTEDATYSTGARIERDASRVGIGRPLPGTRAYVLDGRLQPVPGGVPGELFLAGAGAARGYLGRPDLTAERFLPDPFAAAPGGRLYRTGDLARWLAPGELEHLGRLDQQVKVRGFRIELEEIERVLREHPQVREAAVVVRGAPPGGRSLAAYVAPAETGVEELRRHLGSRLPAYMIPSSFHLLSALPRTLNGKIDRRALPAGAGVEVEFVAPRTPTEELLAGIWAEVLGLERVGIHESFFALGGHSLLAARVVARLDAVCGVELPLRALFERPRLAELAALVEEARRGGADRAIPPLVPVPRALDLPLSFAQERLWFLDRLAPGEPVYNVPAVLRLRGILDAAALQTALEALLERHEALRTVFSEGASGPLQNILPSGPFALERIELTASPAPEAEARREALEEARRPFDLTAGPVIRGRLVRLAPEDHLLVLTIHHIATDGWSLGLLLRDLELLYRPAGERPELPPLPVRYADYALWQRGWMTGAVLEDRIAWWRAALAGAPEVLDLPADRPRPAMPSWRGTAVPFTLPSPVVASLRETARRQDATLFMALLAGFSALLSRFSGQPDLVVGTVAANRGRAELEGVVGFFVNALPLRLRLDGGPGLRTLLGRAREAALGAFAHGDLPFECLVEALAPRRDRARTPLFQVSLAFQETPARPPRLAGLSTAFEPIHTGTSRFDLNLLLEEDGGGLCGGAEADADLFEALTVERMLHHLATLLGTAAADPERPLEDLPLLSQAERRQIVVEWNAPAHEVPAGAAAATLHGLFTGAAAEMPEAVAVTCGGNLLTYAMLDRAANRLARRLRRLGVGPEERVALWLERSPELVVGVLGILKAGGAYVPIDPDVPGERLAGVLEDARPRAVVTQAALAARLGTPSGGRPGIVCVDDPALADEDDDAPADLSGSHHTAYVIYTSGSTGRPKGVVVEHGQAARLFAATHAWFGFSPDDVWTLFHSIAFDFSVWELWGALAFGGRLVVVPYWTSRSPGELLELLAAEEVTVLNQTPSAFHQLLRAESERPAPPGLALRHVIFGGEALEPSSLAPWFERHGDEQPRLVNMYGITETTVHVTFRPLSRADLGSTEGQPVPSLLGRPIPDLQIYLLDRRGEPVPPLVPGEIHVGGAGVARGYLGRPGLTAERFVPDPLSGRAGTRLYRSGDLARRLPGGDLEYLGRTDHQVKVRGFRIELGEVEAVLASHPAVVEAAVLARGTGEEARLVAWVAPARTGAAELRRHLEERLPGYMIPADFVFLDALPLTDNGKLDRRALPEPAGERSSAAAGYAAPRTPAEELVAGIWAVLLDREAVSRDEDFFALGGHSLLAARLVSRLRTALGVEIPLETVFREPTVAALAAAVEGASRTSAPPLAPRSPGAPAPLSPAQERLWFLDRLEPGNPAYNVPLALRLSGPVSAAHLAASLTAVAARHEVLRATFTESAGTPVEEISSTARFPLSVVDLTGLPAAARPAEAALQAGAEARRPFDLAAGPLCRAVLLRLEEEEHLLVLDVHHIAFDGASAEILLHELGCLHAGAPLPPLPVQYADFALWQRAWLDGGALAAELGVWRERLAGAPAALDLPLDRKRPPVQTFRGGAEPVTLPAGQVHALRSLGRSRGATLFMAVLAGWAALLHRWSGAAEVVVGAPVANRRWPELEGLIGLFVNTLPLRVDLAGDPPFTELVDRVRAMALAAYAVQDVPFERLVEAMEAERDLSRSPLFQVMLALTDGSAPTLRLPGVEATEVPLHNGTAKLELLLALHGGALRGAEGGLSGGLEFNAGLFDAATARRLVDQLTRLLAGAAAGPELRIGDLPLLSTAEERQILVDWNATEAPFPRDLGLHELFERQAARTPQAAAVIHGERRVSYAELDARADRLARHLCALGVGPEVLVGIFCGRTPDMVAAILAVLKAGGAYVPLDPAYPADRLAFLLADSGTSVVLAEESVAAALPAFAGTTVLMDRDPGSLDEGGRPCGVLHPGQAAYVIYTSGSTGVPKGVLIRHGSAVARITWALSAYAPEVLSGVLAATSLCFDLSVFEIFVPLAAGGAVILADDALALPGLPAASAVTLVNTIPSAMTELVRADALPRSVRVVNLAGEPLRRDLAARLHALEGVEEVNNLFGPTEDTTYSTAARAERTGEREPAIGRPLPNTRVYLLDPGLRPVPVGAPGELWLGGEGVARGYLGRPDLTADRFRPDPFGPPAGRLYRTGDLARQRTDGTIDYLGRLDHQVKIRGFRIEPGEIEAELAALAGVSQAVVVAREDPGDRRLVAYVVGTAAAGELRRSLRDRLPEHMVPAAFVTLAALPLTPNGKVDRKALPAPEWQSAEESYRAPRTPAEEILAGIWAELLGLERVGAAGHFFDLGGHSLLAMRMMSRLRDALGVEMPLRALFEAPGLADFAARVEAARRAGAVRLTPPLIPRARTLREGPLPLSFAQQRLWLIDQLEPGRPFYNLPMALRIAGPLDAAVLALCLGEIVRRHEPLRTVFAVLEGSPGQVIQPAAPCGLAVIDLSGLPEGRRDATALGLAGEEAGRPFDLTCGPLLRGMLLRLAPLGEQTDHVFALTLHHIAGDGWSVGILVRELTALYAAFAEGKPSPLPELPVQYADFSTWQHSWLQGEILESEISFWRRQLADLPPQLELPTDRPRPAVQSFRGASRPVRLPAELTRRLRALGRREGATLFMVLLAGFQALLARFSGQQDLAVGTPVAGRNQVEIEGLIGFFVNTLVLRGDLSDGRTGEPSLREILGRVRETMLAAQAHQDVPFERLVQELSPERSLAHTPLFQVMLSWQNLPMGPVEIGPAHARLVLSPLDVDPGASKFDLSLVLEEREGGLDGALRYATDLFDRTTVLRLVDHLERLLTTAAAAPERRLADLEIFSTAQRAQLLVEWNDTAHDAPALPVHRLFAQQAERMPPAAVAVRTDGDSLTYGELAARVRAWAGHLRALGAGPEQVVAVCLERSADLVAALLAVLTSGAAYLPLDPRDPAERRVQILEDARPLLLLTRRALAAGSGAVPTFCVEDLPAVADHTAPGADDPAGTLAYVIYTSGSTGRPKGVAVDHTGLSGYLAWIAGVLDGAGVRWLPLLSSVTFDASLKQLFVPLLRGEAVRIVSEDALLRPARLLDILGETPGAGCNTVPTLWEGLLGALERGEAAAPVDLRAIFLGGERLPDDLVARTRLLLPGVAIHNLYGPTEATANAAWSRLDETGRVVLGRPVGGAHIVLADRDLRPVPLGAVGELCVGGAVVARGYLGKPGQTAERFVPDPFGGAPGGRLYRTGDLARRLPDGSLDFLGRLDLQVKVRGFRIELGEIEAVLGEHPDVRAVTVLACGDEPGERRLVAYVAARDQRAPSASDLRSHLERKLPAYMAPSAFKVLEELPRMRNGKIDRSALAALGGLPEEREGGVTPKTPLEKVLAGMVAEILGIDRVGLHDNFFELGWHSMRAIELIARLREAFGIDLPLFYLFDAPTVAGLAGVLLESPEWSQTVEELAPALLQLIEPPADPMGGSDQEKKR